MVWNMQQQQDMVIASNARGMMMRDHDGQFGYRVQPIQPNLQEKIMSLVIDWSWRFRISSSTPIYIVVFSLSYESAYLELHIYSLSDFYLSYMCVVCLLMTSMYWLCCVFKRLELFACVWNETNYSVLRYMWILRNFLFLISYKCSLNTLE